MTKRSLFLSLALLFSLAFSIWLIHDTLQSNPVIAANDTTPDAFILNAHYIRMDKNGNPHLQIYTPQMTHYITHDISNFVTPHFIIYNANSSPWDVTAKYGTSIAGIDQVHLWDDVKIHQAASANNSELTMTTSSLDIFPKKRTASTDQAVTITQPDATINSIGLRANLQKGEIHLLSHARGVYEPSQ